jgi:hypothetical protein
VLPSLYLIHDMFAGTVTVSRRRGGTVVLEDGLGRIKSTGSFRCTASSRDPAQADIVGTQAYIVTRKDGEYEIVAESSIRATASEFHIEIDLAVKKNGEPFFHRKWVETQPRRLL